MCKHSSCTCRNRLRDCTPTASHHTLSVAAASQPPSFSASRSSPASCAGGCTRSLPPDHATRGSGTRRHASCPPPGVAWPLSGPPDPRPPGGVVGVCARISSSRGAMCAQRKAVASATRACRSASSTLAVKLAMVARAVDSSAVRAETSPRAASTTIADAEAAVSRACAWDPNAGVLLMKWWQWHGKSWWRRWGKGGGQTAETDTTAGACRP